MSDTTLSDGPADARAAAVKRLTARRISPVTVIGRSASPRDQLHPS